MELEDIRRVLSIMNNSKVASFFEQDHIMKLVMSGERPNDAEMKQIVANEHLNDIVQSSELMTDIMTLQDRLSAKYELREQGCREDLVQALVELGFDADAVERTIEEKGNNAIRVLQALKVSTTPASTADGE